MAEFHENAIEWLNGQDRITVTFSQLKFANAVRRYAEQKPDDVEIHAENKDGSVTASLQLSWLRLRPTLEMDEERRAAAAERLNAARDKAMAALAARRAERRGADDDGEDVGLDD